MPATTLKDYYKVLELAPTAKAADIKKAYRELAFKYHPDTNKDNAFATTHFIEIQEAYDVLSHEQKRRKYDEERWLNGMSNRAKDQVIVTPDWVLAECVKLRKHMATIDTYRMSHSSLRSYVFLLLSDSHMAVLQQANDADINKQIVQELLQSTRHLKYKYMHPVGERLALLVPADNDMLTAITNQQKRSQRKVMWQATMPLVVVLIAIILCLVMFLWGSA